MVTLFDVGFGEQTWRSIPIWVEYNPTDGWAGLYLYGGDYNNSCLTTFPSDEEGNWVAFEPWQGMLSELQSISQDDIALIRAIAGLFTVSPPPLKTS